MTAIIEHLVVAVIAVGMAFFGYWLMGQCSGAQQKLIKFNGVGTIWLSAVSAVTWLLLYRVGRRSRWTAMLVMGLFSPVLGAILFFPLTPFSLEVIGEFAMVVFPVGVFTGLLISAATSLFHPGNAR